MTLKHTAIWALALLCLSTIDANRRKRPEDPFSIFDRHISNTFQQHYLWPWSQLIKAAAALDNEDDLEQTDIISDKNKCEININVRQFKPEELSVRVKNRNIIIEGKHKETNNQRQRFVANHFVQSFILPPGCEEDEVIAVLKNNRVLNISAPKHALPPPKPEREVPIEVLLVEASSEKTVEVSSQKPELSSEQPEVSSAKPEVSSAKPEVSSAKPDVYSAKPEVSSDKPEVSSDKPEVSSEKPESSSSKPEVSSEKIKETSESIEDTSEKVESLLEILKGSVAKELVDATAAPLLMESPESKKKHLGKIRKKELKTKTVKDNEVTKGFYDNGVEYVLI